MRTVVGLYDDIENAREAVQDLRQAGIERDHISLVARDIGDEYKGYFEREAKDDVTEGAVAGAGVGALLGGLAGLLVGLGTIIIPGVGAILVGGPVLATLGGAAAGALVGGLVGALIDLGIPEEHAQVYAEGVRRGGTLLVVRTTEDMAGQVSDMMDRHEPIDVEEQAEQWEEEGWEGFDEEAEPYSAEEIETHRSSYRDTDMETKPSPGHEMGVETRQPVGERYGESERDRERYQDADYWASESGCVRVYAFETDKEFETRGEMGRQTVTARSGNEREWTEYEPEFRNHYENNYSDTGRGFVYYRPAYLYGCNLASSNRYADYDWSRVEPEARRSWEERNGIGSWDEVDDAVRTSWNRCRAA